MARAAGPLVAGLVAAAAAFLLLSAGGGSPPPAGGFAVMPGDFGERMSRAELDALVAYLPAATR